MRKGMRRYDDIVITITVQSWDLIKSHDCVAGLVHNVDDNTLVLVKQFRPAVYIAGGGTVAWVRG